MTARRVLLLSCFVLCAAPTSARADELVLRGNYYRDRNTRVVQPEAAITKDFSSGTTVGAHYLLDAITSASVAGGASIDKPFTELRNEFGVSLAQRLGAGQLSAAYSYSTESDYWAHFVSLAGSVDLWKKNTTLSVALAYGNDTVGQRMGPTSYLLLGGLQSIYAIASVNQLLAKNWLANLSYDLGVSGFGSKDNGFQANPYRQVLVGGSPSREVVPFQRFRHAVTLSTHYLVPLPSHIVPYLAFRAAFRFYWDDWSVRSYTPELRTFIPVGPVEFRLTGRFYRQKEASFWNDLGDGMPAYAGNNGKTCRHCFNDAARVQSFATSDPKLSRYETMFVELRLLIHLTGLRKLSSFLSGGILELSYGHLFNDNWAHKAWGDADLAGVTFTFPL